VSNSQFWQSNSFMFWGPSTSVAAAQLQLGNLQSQPLSSDETTTSYTAPSYRNTTDRERLSSTNLLPYSSSLYNFQHSCATSFVPYHTVLGVHFFSQQDLFLDILMLSRGHRHPQLVAGSLPTPQVITILVNKKRSPRLWPCLAIHMRM
jgi:hypothetical protein